MSRNASSQTDSRHGSAGASPSNVIRNGERPLKRMLLAVIAVLCTGCECRLSGTPLDTMEKRLNPACWIVDWSYKSPAASPPAATPAP